MAETYENLMSGVNPTLTDSMRLVTSGGASNKALLSAVAKLILETYESTELDDTVVDAINEIITNQDAMHPTFEGSGMIIGGE